MRIPMASKVAGVAFAGMLAGGMLAGCAQPTNETDDAQQANRAYMSQVNQSMETLKQDLSDFNDAVSRKDVVTMKTQAEDAYKTIDKISEIEAPDDLKDIQTDYSTGTSLLKDALNSYIDLYAEVDSATDENPFDWTSYDQRVSAIQKKYDEGIAALQAGDEAAAGKE